MIKLKLLLIALLLGVVGWMLVGCNGFTVAAKATLAARQAGDAIAMGMAMQTRQVTKDCLAKHGSKTKEYAECVKEWRKHRENFRRYAVPAINGGIASAYYSIKLAKEAKQKPETVAPTVKKMFCDIMEQVKKYAPLVKNDWGKKALAALASVEGFVCGK